MKPEPRVKKFFAVMRAMFFPYGPPLSRGEFFLAALVVLVVNKAFGYACVALFPACVDKIVELGPESWALSQAGADAIGGAFVAAALLVYYPQYFLVWGRRVWRAAQEVPGGSDSRMLFRVAASIAALGACFSVWLALPDSGPATHLFADPVLYIVEACAMIVLLVWKDGVTSPLPAKSATTVNKSARDGTFVDF